MGLLLVDVRLPIDLHLPGCRGWSGDELDPVCRRLLHLLECQIHPAMAGLARGGCLITLTPFTLSQLGLGVEGAKQLLHLMMQTQDL